MVLKKNLYLYDCDANNKIIDVKLYIQKETGIPVEEQKLFYQNNKDELVDDRLLKFYSFSFYYADLSLYHVLKNQTLINAKFETNAGDYECKIAASPSLLIKNMKKVLNQRLVFPTVNADIMFNGVVLDDDKTFQDYNIPIQSDIQVIFSVNFKCSLESGMQIFLKIFNGKRDYAFVYQDELVDDLRTFLMIKLKVSYYKISMTFNGQIIMDGSKFSDYGIEKDSTINVSFSYKTVNF